MSVACPYCGTRHVVGITDDLVDASVCQDCANAQAVAARQRIREYEATAK
jgi:hypothetical protein